MLVKLLTKLIIEQALVVILIVWRSDLAIMSTRVGRVNIGEDVGWVSLLIAIVGPVLGREGGRCRWCEGTEVGFIVPWHTRRPRGRELILVWRFSSGGWLEVEERGLVCVDGVEISSSRPDILLGLLWLDGMIVGGCVAKSLDEVVILGDVAGKHVGCTV